MQAPPKEVPRTIENTRVLDETVVSPDDRETLKDEVNDEFSTYFDNVSNPKVLVTSCHRPSMKTHLLMKELCKCIPNSSVLLRSGFDLKKLIPEVTTRNYSDIVIINEDRKMPNALVIVHLPEGPSAHFKLSSFRRGYDIKVIHTNILYINIIVQYIIAVMGYLWSCMVNSLCFITGTWKVDFTYS